MWTGQHGAGRLRDCWQHLDSLRLYYCLDSEWGAPDLQKLAFILRRCAGGWSEPLLLLLPPQTLLPLLLLAWL